MAKGRRYGAVGAGDVHPTRCFNCCILEGHYHSLTLTAYALLIAATVMIAMRAGRVLGRNVSIVGAFVLVGGYLLQCNWISTVNYLNTRHISRP